MNTKQRLLDLLDIVWLLVVRPPQTQRRLPDLLDVALLLGVDPPAPSQRQRGVW